MKRLIISILILAVISLNSVVALADTEIKKSHHRTDKKEVVQVKDKGYEQTADVNNIVDPNKTQIDKGDATAQTWLKISKGNKEVHAWLNKEAKNRITLAKAVHNQVNAELEFLLEIAIEEGAEKTIDAIDQLLAARNTRFEKIIKKLQVEQKSDRMKAQEESRAKRQSGKSRRSRQQK